MVFDVRRLSAKFKNFRYIPVSCYLQVGGPAHRGSMCHTVAAAKPCEGLLGNHLCSVISAVQAQAKTSPPNPAKKQSARCFSVRLGSALPKPPAERKSRPASSGPCSATTGEIGTIGRGLTFISAICQSAHAVAWLHHRASTRGISALLPTPSILSLATRRRSVRERPDHPVARVDRGTP